MTDRPGVVLIEDDPDIRDAVEDLLVHEGYRVDSFENGKEALERFHQCPNPRMILLDLMMPVMDGWEFLKELRNRSDDLRSVPCCVLTAVSNPEILSIKGAQCTLKKPVDADTILEIVRQYCPITVEAPSSGHTLH